MDQINSIFYHSVGATSASLFETSQQKMRQKAKPDLVMSFNFFTFKNVQIMNAAVRNSGHVLSLFESSGILPAFHNCKMKSGTKKMLQKMPCGVFPGLLFGYLEKVNGFVGDMHNG